MGERSVTTITEDYKNHLRKEHDGSKWGTTGYKYSGHALQAVINTRGYINTALDYGCGKGTLAMGFPGLVWTQYDPGIPELSKKPSGVFDLVTCTDVMEHVEEEHVNAVIKELGAHTKFCLFVDVACYPTGTVFGEGPYKGQDMHITVRPPKWWRERFDAESGLTFAGSQEITKVTRKGERQRIQMIYERQV